MFRKILQRFGTVCVVIFNDPYIFGEAPRLEDVEYYRRKLQRHLCEQFKRAVRVELGGDHNPLTGEWTVNDEAALADDPEIQAYVRKLHRKGGFVQFLAPVKELTNAEKEGKRAAYALELGMRAVSR